MKNKINVLLIVLLSCFNTSAEADGGSLVAGQAKFASELYLKLKKPGENLFFSPYSIHTALSMAYMGAEGETALQIADVLKLPSEDGFLDSEISELRESLVSEGKKSKADLGIANQLYYQEGYLMFTAYKDRLSRSFSLSPVGLDFKNDTENSRETINSWVESVTNDKIVNLIPEGSVSPLTRAVLVNAIYFKAKWENVFLARNTKSENFHVSKSESLKTSLMNGTFSAPYFENEKMQVLELPYQGEAFSMLLFLPKEDSSLEVMEKDLYNLISSEMALENREVKISIPKFILKYGAFLKENLKEMGMTDAFDEKKANFSNMSAEKGLSISEVIHQAFLDVQEEGTEATAATVVVMVGRSIARPEPEMPVFRADRPFVFLIRERSSGIVLFLGRFVKPV